MRYDELVELSGTDVFTTLTGKFPFLSSDVGNVFKFKYGFREVLSIYSALDSTTAKDIILNKANELSLTYGKKWQTLYDELITKDFETGTITNNQTNLTETVSGDDTTNRTDKISGYDSKELVTDTGSDETKTGTHTTTSNTSYTGSTSKQSEREQALAGLQNSMFYDIIFTDVIVSFCGYIL